jgi:hypothetical protein
MDDTVAVKAKRRDPTAGARRQRQRLGLSEFKLILNEDSAALAVILAGLLSEVQAQDHEAVEHALEQLVTRLLLRT